VTDLFLDAVSVAGAGLVPVEEAAALGVSSVLEFVGRRRRICGKVVLVVLLLAQGVHLAQLHPLGQVARQLLGPVPTLVLHARTVLAHDVPCKNRTKPKI